MELTARLIVNKEQNLIANHGITAHLGNNVILIACLSALSSAFWLRKVFPPASISNSKNSRNARKTALAAAQVVHRQLSMSCVVSGRLVRALGKQILADHVFHAVIAVFIGLSPSIPFSPSRRGACRRDVEMRAVPAIGILTQRGNESLEVFGGRKIIADIDSICARTSRVLMKSRTKMHATFTWLSQKTLSMLFTTKRSIIDQHDEDFQKQKSIGGAGSAGKTRKGRGMTS